MQSGDWAASAPEARVLARLAEQFRSDVAAAVRQVPGPQQGERQFVLEGDRLVAYRVFPGEVGGRARRVSRRGTILRLAQRSGRRRFTVRSEPAPAVANLVIPIACRRERALPAAGREMRVAACWARIIASPSRRSEANSMGRCNFQRRRGRRSDRRLVCLSVAAADLSRRVRQIAMERRAAQMNQRACRPVARRGWRRAGRRPTGRRREVRRRNMDRLRPGNLPRATAPW